jgi:bacteriophage CI repressor
MGAKIDNTEVAKRIAELIEYSGMKVADFAERVGIQKSAVSHLISGRNKPSFEVLSSMLILFPELNPDWLILGTGNMLRQTNISQPTVHTSPATLKDLNKISVKSIETAPSAQTETVLKLQEEEEIYTRTDVNNDTVATNLKQSTDDTKYDAITTVNTEDKMQAQQSTQNKIIKDTTNVICHIPDIVVLQPDGRYIRYRAIEE